MGLMAHKAVQKIKKISQLEDIVVEIIHNERQGEN